MSATTSSLPLSSGTSKRKEQPTSVDFDSGGEDSVVSVSDLKKKQRNGTHGVESSSPPPHTSNGHMYDEEDATSTISTGSFASKKKQELAASSSSPTPSSSANSSSVHAHQVFAEKMPENMSQTAQLYINYTYLLCQRIFGSYLEPTGCQMPVDPSLSSLARHRDLLTHDQYAKWTMAHAQLVTAFDRLVTLKNTGGYFLVWQYAGDLKRILADDKYKANQNPKVTEIVQQFIALAQKHFPRPEYKNNIETVKQHVFNFNRNYSDEEED